MSDRLPGTNGPRSSLPSLITSQGREPVQQPGSGFHKPPWLLQFHSTPHSQELLEAQTASYCPEFPSSSSRKTPRRATRRNVALEVKRCHHHRPPQQRVTPLCSVSRPPLTISNSPPSRPERWERKIIRPHSTPWEVHVRYTLRLRLHFPSQTCGKPSKRKRRKKFQSEVQVGWVTANTVTTVTEGEKRGCPIRLQNKGYGN